MTSGLADTEIRIDVLSDIHQEMPLDKMVQLVETKEAGKKSASRLMDTQNQCSEEFI